MLKQDDYKQHISERFNTELEDIKKQLLEMGGMVEQQLAGAVAALVSVDTSSAETIVARDAQINQMEMAIDDQCASILARRQPAASDLRLIITSIKVNTDIERIGDEAAKVARQSLQVTEEGKSPSNYVEIKHIGDLVGDMLRNALDAYARLDVDLAVGVVKQDRIVDSHYGSAMRSLVTFMMEDPRSISAVLTELWALRSLERVGDHASNIAEHVVYLVRGQDVRHQSLEDFVEQVEDPD